MTTFAGNLVNLGISIQDATGVFRRLGDAMDGLMRTVTVDKRQATDADIVIVEFCWAIRGRSTKSERRTIDRLLKLSGQAKIMNEIHLTSHDIIGLAKIAYRYRDGLPTKTVVMIALKGGAPAEHPGAAR